MVAGARPERALEAAAAAAAGATDVRFEVGRRAGGPGRAGVIRVVTRNDVVSAHAQVTAHTLTDTDCFHIFAHALTSTGCGRRQLPCTFVRVCVCVCVRVCGAVSSSPTPYPFHTSSTPTPSRVEPRLYLSTVHTHTTHRVSRTGF